MDYQNTLLYLYNSVPMFQQVGSSAYKEGLENTLALDEQVHFILLSVCIIFAASKIGIKKRE